MTQAWPWPILPQGQIGSYMCLNGEKFYKVINWEKLAINDQFDRNLCFWQKKLVSKMSCKLYEIGAWKILSKVSRVIAFCKFGYLNLSARYLENYLS